MAEDYLTKGDFQALNPRTLERLEAVDTRVAERIEAMETRLLNEFRKWGARIEARLKATETLSIGFSKRLDSVEERLTDLEDRNLQ